MKHDYHGKPASLSARLMRVAMRYKKEERPEKAAELEAVDRHKRGTLAHRRERKGRARPRTVLQSQRLYA